MLKWIPIAILVVFFLRGLGMYGQSYFMSYVGEGIIRRLRDMLYNRITDLPLAFFYQEKTGVLMSRLTNDVNIIKNMVSNAVTGAMHDFFKILFLTITIFLPDLETGPDRFFYPSHCILSHRDFRPAGAPGQHRLAGGYGRDECVSA